MWKPNASHHHKLEYIQGPISEPVFRHKTVKVAIFVHGGHFNPDESMVFRQFANVEGCVRSFMLAPKCRDRISDF